MHFAEGLINPEYSRYTRRKTVFIIAALAALGLMAVLSISMGAANIPVMEVIRALAGISLSRRAAIIVWNIRLPQVLAAIVAGAGLSVAGAVMVENQNVLKMDPMAIARRIGYVAQHQTAGRITAFDAILMGRRPHIHYRVSEKDLRIVDGAIKSLHLDKLAMRYIDQMSGGELQKVAVGRALVQEPSLLLLDEPTSNLDLKNQVEILKLIRRVVREHPVCAIMTLHDLSMALRFADQCIFLKDGGIHAAVPAREVSAEIIREVYDINVEIHHHHGYPVVIPS